MSTNNDYDLTKKMLSTIRNRMTIAENTITKSYLTEQEVQPSQDEVSNINDVDVRIISDDSSFQVEETTKTELSGLIDSFRDQVSQIALLTPGLTIKEDQIRLDGTLEDYDLKFVYIGGNDTGLYISSEMSKMDEESFGFISKLYKFEQTFKDTVEPLIRERRNM